MRLRDRFDRNKRQPSTRNQRIGLAFFWLVVVSLAYVIPSAPSFNTESHLYVAFSVVDHHTLNIDAYHRRLGDESYYRGHYYSDKAPGLSLLAVPAYAVFRLVLPGHRAQQYFAQGRYLYGIPSETIYIRYALTYVLLIVPAALFAVLLWLFFCRFIPSGWALALAGVYALGTTARIYSMGYFSHQICAMLLFGAFMLVFWRVRDAEPGRGPLVAAAGAGFLAGYAIISEYPTAVIAGLLGLYLAAAARSRLSAVACYLVGAAPATAVGLGYNLLAFGKPLATGYNYVDSFMYKHRIAGGSLGLGNPSSYGIQLPTWNAFWQITFGPYRGIFLLCPILLLFFVGALFMWQRHEMRRELLLCVAVVVIYFLVDASRPADVNGWSGGASVASRHLVPMLPFMVFPVAFTLGSPFWRRAFVLLGGLSTVMMTVISISPEVRGFSLFDGNPLVNELWYDVSRGRLEVNWGQMLGVTGPVTLLPLFLILSLLVVRLVWVYRRVTPAGTVMRETAVPVAAT